MRVISGIKRGLNLLSPKGEETRPTTDRVKENIFNLITGYTQEVKVLDLFSGSGAMGIEALSRGADSCVFTDLSKDAVEIIRKNIDKTGFNDISLVYQTDFEKYLNSTNEKFSLIFLDPPYHNGFVDKAIAIIRKRGLLTEDGIIVCETDFDEEIDLSSFLLIKERIYGRVRVRVIGKES